MRHTKFILVTAASLLLASCGGINVPVSSSSSEASSAPSSSSQSPSPSQSSSASQAQSSEQTEEILLVNENSKLIGTPKANPDNPTQALPELEENMLIAPLKTYHRKGKGAVPYVDLADLSTAINTSLSYLLTPGLTTEVKADGFHIYSADKNGEMILDDLTDTVKIKNSGAFARPILLRNNGIDGDYITFRGNSIRESDQTKVYKIDGSAVPQYETYSFGKYGFDIYAKDGKYYAPFEAMSKVLYYDVAIDMAYNGVDFYLNAAAGSNFIGSRINSSNGWWKGYGCIWQPTTPGQGEAYRFGCSFERAVGMDDQVVMCTKFMRLFDDAEKTGKIFTCTGETFDESKEITTEETAYDFRWQKSGDLLRIRLLENGAPNGDYWVHLDETYFLRDAIPAEVSQYNYNILRFLFDNVYGLKEVKNYTDAEDYFTTVGVKDGLQSSNPNVYNEAMAKLLGAIDDGHTKHTGLSIFTGLDHYADLTDLSKQHAGQRLKTLTEKYATYAKARVDKYHELVDASSPDDANFYQGLRISQDKSTIILTFDAFTHSDAEIKNMKELYPDGITDPDATYQELNYNIRSRFIFSTPDGMSSAFTAIDALNKDHATKNIVLDLTVNGGGHIAVLPYLAAFFTDDPVYPIIDPHNGLVYEYHYKVDLNGDGVFGGEGDTYKGKYNFFILTSGFSFSCGNCLPGMAKDAGCKIIGERSGGGSSPVGVFMDAVGGSFDISNCRMMSYKGTDGKYMHNDAGIPLDYEFPLQNGNWYDPNAVSTFVNSISN